MLARFTGYWRQPDHYAWMVGYLRARGLDTRVRLLVAWAIASYSVLPLSMLWSPSGPHGPWTRVVVSAAAGSVLLSALSLAWRWPSRRSATVRALVADVATAMVCLSYANTMVGVVGCMTFAMLGGQIAFFHSVRLQVVNLGLGLTTVTVLAIRALQMTGDVIVTINLYVVVAVAILALSVTAQVLVHFLGGDLDASDTDSLTGLCNRRAFYRATHRLLAESGSAPTENKSVTMIDLDDFKRLNDSRGHRAGDRALIGVSRLLEDLTADRGVVARVGGEEFLIATPADSASAKRCAAEICVAIADSEFDITASVGIASAMVNPNSVDDENALINHLIDLADTAMYDAKRAGGNQFHPGLSIGDGSTAQTPVCEPGA
jgi:diguanylate cyclase (GGDEF)-like protein